MDFWEANVYRNKIAVYAKNRKDLESSGFYLWASYEEINDVSLTLPDSVIYLDLKYYRLLTQPDLLWKGDWLSGENILKYHHLLAGCLSSSQYAQCQPYNVGNAILGENKLWTPYNSLPCAPDISLGYIRLWPLSGFFPCPLLQNVQELLQV